MRASLRDWKRELRGGTAVNVFGKRLSRAVHREAITVVIVAIGAIMADEVPDAQKGLVAGLMGAAHPFSSLVAVGVTLHALGSQGTRTALLCAVIAGLVLPLLLALRERRDPLPEPPPALRLRRRADFARIWVARVLVQIAGNGLSTYGLFYFLAVMGQNGVALGHANDPRAQEEPADGR